MCAYVIMELGSIVGSTVHLTKKLTFYACRTGRGMGVYTLQTGMLRVRIRALRRPYCPTEVKARWWYSFGEMIQNVSIGSGIDADYTEKRKLQFQ